MFSGVEKLDEINQALGWDIEYRQMGKGGFTAEFAALEGGGISLVTEAFNNHLLIHCVPPEGFIGVLLPSLIAGSASACGHALASRELITFPSSAEMKFVTHNEILNETVYLPEEMFQSASRALVPGAKLITPGTVKIHNGDGNNFLGIQHKIRALQQKKDLNIETASNVLTRIILWLADSNSQFGDERLSYRSREAIARRAMTYIEESFRGPIQLEDLCKYTGVGLRSLQRCFASSLQVSPLVYIKARRLNAVRRDLLAADPCHHLVTQIASDNGFLHLGRFSGDYHAYFGELPSETLAKTRISIG